MVHDAKEKRYYSELKKRSVLLLEGILTNDSNSEVSEIEKIDSFLFSFFKPQIFQGPNGMEVKFLRGFEETCILLSQHISRDPKKMTVFEFYQSFQTIKTQIQERNKANNKRRG